MPRTFLYLILLIFTITYSDYSNSQDVGLSKVNTGSGLHTTDFNIEEGILTIYLPSDLTVAENASGTMYLRSIGAQSNISQVKSKYNLVVESQAVDINGNKFMVQIPINLPTGVLSVTLQDKEGKVLNRAFFPVRLTKRSKLPLTSGGVGNFRTPVTSRAGMPSIVNGPFDGNFNNSFISISGQPVDLLSESTRQLVFMIPDGVQGPKVLSLREGATEFKTPFTILYVVKVGRDNPELISRKDGTIFNSPTGGSQGVLIESEKQFGKIDLQYNPDLGDTSQDQNSPIPVTNKLNVKEEPALGPSITDLSKPLEIDPQELNKYSQTATPAKDYNTNEFTSLKQFSDKPKKGSQNQNQLVSKSPETPDPAINSGQAGYGDINEVKSLLDTQINSPFTPLESTSVSKPKKVQTPKNPATLKETPEVPAIKSVSPIPEKKEVKPAISKKKETTKPIEPKIASVKPAPKPENRIKEEQSDKAVAEKPLEPNIKPKPIKTKPPVKKKDKKIVASSNKELKVVKATDYSDKMNDKAVKVKIKTDKPATEPVKQKTKKQDTTKSITAVSSTSKSDSNKFKQIKDLNSLNTKDSSFKSTVTKKENNLEKKSQKKIEEQIKENKYESLQKKEINNAVVQPPSVKGKFAIQLASFKNKNEASDLVGKLKANGYDVYYKRFKVPGKGYWYRVRKGGFSTRNEAETYKSSLNLSKYHISSFFVTIED